MPSTAFVGRLWEDDILPALTGCIAIHNVSPAYERIAPSGSALERHLPGAR